VLASILFEKAFKFGYSDVIAFELDMTLENSLKEQNVMLAAFFSNTFVVILGDAMTTATVLLHMAVLSAQPLGIMTFPHQFHLLRALEGHIMVGILEPMLWAPPVGGEQRHTKVFNSFEQFNIDYIARHWDHPGGTFDDEFQFLGLTAVKSTKTHNIGRVGYQRSDFRTRAPFAALQLASALEVIVMAFVAGNGQGFDFPTVASAATNTLLGKVFFNHQGKRLPDTHLYKTTLTRQWFTYRTGSTDPTLLESGLTYLTAYLNFTKESTLGDPFANEPNRADVSALPHLDYPLQRWVDKESLLYPCQPGCAWLGYRC
jgi:hypothetical protein